jgi:hypothetical protein
VCLHVADENRVHNADTLGRAEVTMPLGGIPALWIPAWSLIAGHIGLGPPLKTEIPALVDAGMNRRKLDASSPKDKGGSRLLDRQDVVCAFGKLPSHTKVFAINAIPPANVL